MNTQTTLAKMLVLATNAHSEQFDKGGSPYILHPIAVMHLLGPTADEELKAIAVGHDLLEDTDVTFMELYRTIQNSRVVDAIEALTKRHNEDYTQYISRVCSNKDAILVKMADIRHNTDVTRLKGTSDKDVVRMKKYMETYKLLQNKLDEYENKH